MLFGSWTTQDTILALLMFQMGIIFTMAINLTTLKSDSKHLTKKVSALAKDFKDYQEGFHKLTLDVHMLKRDYHTLSTDFKSHVQKHK